MHTIAEWWMWGIFFVVIFTAIALDLFVLGGNKKHVISTQEALKWVGGWISLALIFVILLWWYLQHHVGIELANQKSQEFLVGYIIELSLSVDNLFVFILFFNYFAVPREYQHRVLVYGILGAIILRFIMILLGVLLVSTFHWILYVFGLFLLVTGIKMLFIAEHATDLQDNWFLKILRKNLRITPTFHGELFFVKLNNLLYVTPLFIVLILIELSDVVFAVDSIPAIFSVTQDPFIVFSSNIFAILGLRALYFLLANMAQRFAYLKYGLSLILIFIGTKMLIADFYKVPTWAALSFIISTLSLSILISILKTHVKKV